MKLRTKKKGIEPIGIFILDVPMEKFISLGYDACAKNFHLFPRCLLKYILGLDVGTKTIGLAKLCIDNEITTPLETIQRKSVKKDVARIFRLCVDLSITEVVVGLPYQLDGTEGRSAKLARQIGKGLQEESKFNLLVHYYDERFSTQEAQQKLIASGKSAMKRKKMIDAVAACVILQHYLFARNLDK